ncbi:hypothetical protein Ancab_002062 [Ancistrocladus abbreviatus]
MPSDFMLCEEGSKVKTQSVSSGKRSHVNESIFFGSTKAIDVGGAIGNHMVNNDDSHTNGCFENEEDIIFKAEVSGPLDRPNIIGCVKESIKPTRLLKGLAVGEVSKSESSCLVPDDGSNKKASDAA